MNFETQDIYCIININDERRTYNHEILYWN